MGFSNIEKLNKACVMIIGLGGVGGHALESIVRSGIGNIIIIDKDVIDVTNINRQLLALTTNIGKNKVDVAEQRILDINPECNVVKINEFITKDNMDLIFNNKIDFIIDCCDTVETKKQLIRESIIRNIKIISCMGTANKLDPSKLEIVDIRKTSADPLARFIRKMIKDEMIKNKIMVVCSSELPIKNNLGVLSSNSFVPSSAGILCASYVIKSIISEGDISENK